METTSAVPNPGSDEAVTRGCTCPVLDNARGRGITTGIFWITEGCPLHAPRSHDTQHPLGKE